MLLVFLECAITNVSRIKYPKDQSQMTKYLIKLHPCVLSDLKMLSVKVVWNFGSPQFTRWKLENFLLKCVVKSLSCFTYKERFLKQKF